MVLKLYQERFFKSKQKLTKPPAPHLIHPATALAIFFARNHFSTMAEKQSIK
jgi:hypothetical protein